MRAAREQAKEAAKQTAIFQQGKQQAMWQAEKQRAIKSASYFAQPMSLAEREELERKRKLWAQQEAEKRRQAEKRAQASPSGAASGMEMQPSTSAVPSGPAASSAAYHRLSSTPLPVEPGRSATAEDERASSWSLLTENHDDDEHREA